MCARNFFFDFLIEKIFFRRNFFSVRWFFVIDFLIDFLIEFLIDFWGSKTGVKMGSNFNRFFNRFLIEFFNQFWNRFFRRQKKNRETEFFVWFKFFHATILLILVSKVTLFLCVEQFFFTLDLLNRTPETRSRFFSIEKNRLSKIGVVFSIENRSGWNRHFIDFSFGFSKFSHISIEKSKKLLSWFSIT